MSVLSRLADGFDVQLDCVVKHVEVVRREGVDYTSIRVTDTRGNEAVADRVKLLAQLAVEVAHALFSLGDSDSAPGCAQSKHGHFYSRSQC